MRGPSGLHAAIVALCGVTLAVACGCGTTSPDVQQPTPVYSVAFETEPAAPVANAHVTLAFAIRDEAGSTVSRLRIVHEKPIHLIVVSADLAVFEHIHPEVRADGTFAVDTRFPSGGDYDLYASYAPFDAPEQLAHLHCTVA